MTHIEENSIEKSPKMIPKKKVELSHLHLNQNEDHEVDTFVNRTKKINDIWRKFNVISNSYLIKKQSENKTKKNPTRN